MEALGDEFAVVGTTSSAAESRSSAGTTLYNIPRFVRELGSAPDSARTSPPRRASWGTILAYEYYQAHPDHVASLTFMSACLDVGAWERNANALVKTLSESSQRAIGAAIASRRWDSKEFEAANGEFMSKYVFLQPPRQPDWDSTMSTVGMDQYMYMWGPSEFATIGTLGGYSALGGLAAIRVPTLFTVGSNDEADTTTIKTHAAMVPGARVAIIPNAAHLTMWDNPDESVRVVREFLRSVSR
jgi:proline iminopeptidase